MQTNDKSTVLWIVGAVILVFVWWSIKKLYKLKHDNVIEFVGGEGSGKTLSAVKLALQLYQRKLKEWARKKLKYKLAFWLDDEEKKAKVGPKPGFYSNIPVVEYKKGKTVLFSKILTADILTLKQGIEPGSVLLIDELGRVCDQYVNYRCNLIRFDMREFMDLFRQYSQGGYMVCTDQVSSDNSKPIRDRINVFYYCFNFTKVLTLFKCVIYKYRIKSFMRVDGVENVNGGAFVEDGSKFKWGVITTKLYDTYCYSGRYEKLAATVKKDRWKEFKTNTMIEVIPHISPLDDPEDAATKRRQIEKLKKEYGKSVTKTLSGEDETD